jgi:hypothetical protein
MRTPFMWVAIVGAVIAFTLGGVTGMGNYVCYTIAMWVVLQVNRAENVSHEQHVARWTQTMHKATAVERRHIAARMADCAPSTGKDRLSGDEVLCQTAFNRMKLHNLLWARWIDSRAAAATITADEAAAGRAVLAVNTTLLNASVVG